MTTSYKLWTLFTALQIIIPLWAALPPSQRYPLPIVPNRITDISLTCDERSINVTLALQHPFKGLLFAKDFAQECNTIGALTNSITITLPTSGCGVRLNTKRSDGKLFYGVTLVIQQDRHLRQIADQEKFVECMLEESAFMVNSKAMSDAIRNYLGQKKNYRSGRMKHEGWSKELEEPQLKEELSEALEAARAWMEITPEEDKRPFATMQVGEPAVLTVKSTLPVGIGWRVVECIAHDGLGDSSQRLLDEQGCPIDELLMPVLQFGPVRPIALMRHQEAVARFIAFKFPDRDRLHVSCGLQLCRGSCPQVDCNIFNDTNENRLPRKLSIESEGEVLDRIEVFNSVEVLAPAIDDLRSNDKTQISAESLIFTSLEMLLSAPACILLV